MSHLGVLVITLAFTLSKLELQEGFEQKSAMTWLRFLNDHAGCCVASRLLVEGKDWKRGDELGESAAIQVREMKTQT